MEHQAWQIKHEGVPVSDDSSMSNYNNATMEAHLHLSAPLQSNTQVPFAQLKEDAHKDEYENSTFFVNMTSTVSEKDYKRFVRSQAMKAYHAKRRRKAALEEDAQPANSTNLNYGRSVNKWSQDPFVHFPVDLTPPTREFLHSVFTDPRAIVQTYRHIQFGNGLNCGAAFYQTLANLANWVRLVGGTSESMKSYMYDQEMQHTARALSLVRKMLLDPKEQLSQGVVSAGKPFQIRTIHPPYHLFGALIRFRVLVASLTVLQIMNDDMVAAAYHLDGLERIIDLRGGFETLDYDVQAYISWYDYLSIHGYTTPPPNVMVEQAINIPYQRGEVFLATVWDTKPRFIAPVDYYKRITAFDAPLTPGTIAIVKVLRQHYPSLSTHTELIEEATRLNNVYQREIINRRVLNNGDGNVHNGFCYHLASTIQPIDFRDEPTVVGEIIRLSLFIYHLPVWRYMASMSSNSFSAIQQLKKLRVAMEGNEIDWSKLMSLKAWVVVMGLLNSTEVDDTSFWTKLWVETLHKLENRKAPPLFEQMESGEAAQESFSKGCLSLYVPKAVTSMIWLEEFHGARYREIVRTIVGGS